MWISQKRVQNVCVFSVDATAKTVFLKNHYLLDKNFTYLVVCVTTLGKSSHISYMFLLPESSDRRKAAKTVTPRYLRKFIQLWRCVASFGQHLRPEEDEVAVAEKKH